MMIDWIGSPREALTWVNVTEPHPVHETSGALLLPSTPEFRTMIASAARRGTSYMKRTSIAAILAIGMSSMSATADDQDSNSGLR
jgi:hypothetical protein